MLSGFAIFFPYFSLVKDWVYSHPCVYPGVTENKLNLWSRRTDGDKVVCNIHCKQTRKIYIDENDVDHKEDYNFK